MQPIRTLVADDELVALRGLGRLLQRRSELRLIGEARTGREVVEIVRAERPELLLLDIQMPDLDGLGALDELDADERPVTIFITAHEDHALEAFRVQAVDYLLKPFADERLDAALDRAREQVELRRLRAADGAAWAEGVRGGYLTRLLVRGAGRLTFVDVSEIDWIAAADYYAEIRRGAERHLVREPLQELERRLDPAHFVRVHRSAIVRLGAVREIQPYFNGRYVLLVRNGDRVVVSRRRRAALEAALGQRL